MAREVPGGSASFIARLLGFVRLVHPFPSALDAVAVAAIAAVAGADVSVTVRLAVGMLGLQFAIGTANDLADTPRDRGTRPRKPIPTGLVDAGHARAVLIIVASAGLASAASVGFGPLVVAALGLSDGFGYDLRLKGTPLSWLPFAIGVALLPVYAWLGATGGLPVAFWGIVPLALLAGSVLAVANAVADMGVDRQATASSVATLLGRRGSIAVDTAGLVAVQFTVVATAAFAGLDPVAAAAELAGIVLGFAGLALIAYPNERVARLGWETQAIAIVALGAGWMSSLGSAGLL